MDMSDIYAITIYMAITLKDLHKTFWGTTKKCENKNLTQCFLFVIFPT